VLGSESKPGAGSQAILLIYERILTPTLYERQNGNLKLSLLSPNGVPFGSIPRFLVSYLATEAKRTGSPVISLGRSQNEFVKLLGMNTAGGAQKNRMKTQCKKFFTTMLSVEVSRINEKGFMQEAMENVLVAKKAFIFWQLDFEQSYPIQLFSVGDRIVKF
jgi:hypothetical protein